MRILRERRAEGWMLLLLLLNLALYGGMPLAYNYGAPYDDGLMINAALNLSGLKWLGAYNQVTLAKGIAYPVWMVLLNFLNLPLQLGNQLLYGLSCLALCCALRPLVKGGAARFLLFALLLFNPVLITSNTLMRVYRESIVPSLCLLVLAWIIGIYARKWDAAFDRRTWTPYVLLGVVALPAWWFVREDAFWLLPFIVFGLLLTFLPLCFGREKLPNWRLRFLRMGFALTPVLSLVLCGALIAGMNFLFYGRFVVNDYLSGEFQNAYGALTRIEQEAWNPRTPVSRDAREKAYAVSPAFAELEAELEGAQLRSYNQNLRHADEDFSDYGGDYFFWALRNAAAAAGYYENAQTSRDFYLRLAQEINAALDEGQLPARAGKRATLTPPFDTRYIEPTWQEFQNALWRVARMEQISVEPAQTPIYYGTTLAEYREMERLTNSNFLLQSQVYPLRIEGWAVDRDGSSDELRFWVTNAYGRTMPLLVENRDEDAENFTLVLEEYVPGENFLLFVTGASGEVVSIPIREDYETRSSGGLSARVDTVSVYGAYPMDERQNGTDWVKLKLDRWLLVGYQHALPVLCVVAVAFYLLLLGFALGDAVRRRRVRGSERLWVLTGVLLTFLLRVAMLAYVTATSFDATNNLYLGSAYPLLLLFVGLSIYGLARRLKRPKRRPMEA